MAEASREIAAFPTPAQAHLARVALEDAGIPAYVADESTSNAFGFPTPFGGIRLYVPVTHIERAVAILQELEKNDAGETEPALGEDLPDESEPGAAPAVVTDAAAPEPGARRREDDPGGEDWARRTRTAAFVGLAVPLLALGALFRLVFRPAGVVLSPVARRHVRQAWWTVGLTLAAWVVLYAYAIGTH